MTCDDHGQWLHRLPAVRTRYLALVAVAAGRDLTGAELSRQGESRPRWFEREVFWRGFQFVGRNR